MTFRPRRVQAPEITDAPRVVVVGHCGAGKSTVVAGLRDRGIDAVASAQEHSMVTDLWRRSDADLLIYLDIDLETLRRRRGKSWSETIYDVQEVRLAGARSAADIVIDTGVLDFARTVEAATELVDDWRDEHIDRATSGVS